MLAARLAIAKRGADLLDRKRQALMHEHARVHVEAVEAHRAWRRELDEAERWSARSLMLDGAGRLDLLARHATMSASLALSWSNAMGAQLPSVDRVSVPEPPLLSALGGSSAAVLAARAWREAALAAARCAVAERAQTELSTELARATRRLRALENRWIPEHKRAFAQLDLALDENQREQATRVRWLNRRLPNEPT
jgi:V/A-type H+-transporting ATPase subunit D